MKKTRLPKAVSILTISTLSLLVAIICFKHFISNSQAGSLTITHQVDWEEGTLIDVEADSKEGEIKLSPLGTWGVQSLKSPNKPISVGSAFASDGNDIYVVRGYGDITFWRYTPTTDSWTDLANLPRGAYFGMDLQYLDGYFYAIFGGYQRSFARYSVADDSWEMLSSIPDLVHQGGSLTSDGTDIYATRGNNTQDFYKYSVDTDAWMPLAGPPAALRNGADITYIDGYILYPQGK
jgi:hypothetical protein